MTQNDSQVPWTDEQWARVNQVIQEEASRARVAATFLPLFGPLPPDTDFVRKEEISDHSGLTIDDTDTIKLLTLQVKVHIRGAQMADREMTSVLALFRRAANVLSRLEDALIFNGRADANQPPTGAPPRVWEILSDGEPRGLLASDAFRHADPVKNPIVVVSATGQSLVAKVSESIGKLEADGHFGPFAITLGQDLFLAAQTPDPGSFVLPQDRILPFLGGGPLLRSSTLPANKGVVVALGGAPVELVVATDVSLGFLQITTEPIFVFRVFEKIVLRIKQSSAIVALLPPAGTPAAVAGTGPTGATGTDSPGQQERRRRGR